MFSTFYLKSIVGMSSSWIPENGRNDVLELWQVTSLLDQLRPPWTTFAQREGDKACLSKPLLPWLSATHSQSTSNKYILGSLLLMPTFETLQPDPKTKFRRSSSSSSWWLLFHTMCPSLTLSSTVTCTTWCMHTYSAMLTLPLQSAFPFLTLPHQFPSQVLPQPSSAAHLLSKLSLLEILSSILLIQLKSTYHSLPSIIITSVSNISQDNHKIKYDFYIYLFISML